MHLCNVEAFSGLQELPLHAALHTPCGHVLSCELHRRSTVCAEHAGPGSRNPDLELPSCSEVLLFLLCVSPPSPRGLVLAEPAGGNHNQKLGLVAVIVF